MKRIENQTFDQERALYGSADVFVKNCTFDGPADGESAFKECRNIQVENCFWNLRYPFWHDHGLKIRASELTGLCRGSPVVFRFYRDFGYKAAWNQGASGMQ